MAQIDNLMDAFDSAATGRDRDRIRDEIQGADFSDRRRHPATSSHQDGGG
ncbi:hypothetical protein [Saccharopolyspora pogona]|nr:hypothetical protein [Saccharopolyspora pogona]